MAALPKAGAETIYARLRDRRTPLGITPLVQQRLAALAAAVGYSGPLTISAQQRTEATRG